MTVKLLHIVGARPQFIKYFPLQQAMALARGRQGGGLPLTSLLVHTGQHYDYRLSQIFFDEMGIRPPDYHLDVGSGTHGQQTAWVIERVEEVLLKERPDGVVVYGDTNSTLGGALAASKLHIPVIHVESGLRSFNRRMPEETNRILTDHLAGCLFCPSETAVENLRREGIADAPQGNPGFPCVVNVGDVMYDVLLYALGIADERSRILDRLGIQPGGYDLMTLHRAETTDDPRRLAQVADFINEATAQRPVIFPIHPRMAKVYAGAGRIFRENIRIIEPLGYFDLLKALKHAGRLWTDSGGMQKEAYWLETPCVTLRDETEWVETVQSGWNVLWRDYRGAQTPWGKTDAYGDGGAAKKMIDLLTERMFPHHG